jgi:predicted RNA binding protein YcfA (HicA-like mRNA interferase family)
LVFEAVQEPDGGYFAEGLTENIFTQGDIRTNSSSPRQGRSLCPSHEAAPRCFGQHLASVLCRGWQYRRVHQSGSYVIIETEEPSHQRVAVPNHHAIRVGTLNAILRAEATHK